MFQSATIRLTGWYLAILMAASLFFSVALWLVSTGQVAKSLHHPSYIGGLGGSLNSGPIFDQYRIDRLHEIEGGLAWSLLAFNTTILLVGGGASYLLAKHTLRPIEEALEAQARFTADASHELRTPLTSMKTEIEVALREKSLSEASARSLLESNLEEIAHLQALASGLLRLAQYQNGQTVPILQPVTTAKVIHEAIHRVNAAAKAKLITLEPETTGAILEAESDSLTELLVILLDNAVKYGHKNGHVWVSTAVHGSHVVFVVRDDGPGIAGADLPHLFDRFYRADSARTKQSTGGYGLGLAIAKQIVELHHGHLVVESALGHGATFTVRLPMKKAKARA